MSANANQMSKKINKEYIKLKKTYSDYQSQCRKFQNELSDKIEFDFYVDYQPSDGFVIGHSEECHNAPVFSCLNIIEKKGVLTYDDYKDVLI